MVVYMEDKVVLAAGHLQHRDFLHVHKIPTDHMCVLITKVSGNDVQAPLAVRRSNRKPAPGEWQIFCTTKKESIPVFPYIYSRCQSHRLILQV